MDPRTALVVLTSFATLPATDIYLPSLPGMAGHFGVSEEAVRATISIFLVGSLIAAPIIGVLSDRFGRRPVLIASLVVFICGSIACSISDGLSLLLVGRFLQGVGSVATPVVGWAIIHDIYPKDKGATVMSWMGAIFAACPLIAPAIGGLIDVTLGWRWNFILISLFASIAFLLAAAFLTETHTKATTSELSAKKVIASYVSVFTNITFMSYVGIFALVVCGEWCYFTVAPFYFENMLHFTPDKTGFYISLVGVIYFLGTLATPAIITRRGAEGTILVGLLVSLAGALMLAAVYFVAPTIPIAISAALGIYLIGTAIIWGPTTTLALQRFEHERGAASAVRALVLNATFVLGSVLGGVLGGASLLPLALALLFFAGTALLLSWRLAETR